MAVSAASALNVTGTDTDARDYTTASWTPTVGKVYCVAFAQLDLGGSKTTPTISGNNITWVGGSGNETGGTSTQPSLTVWTGYADSSATAGSITFSGCVSSGQTADGAIWGIVELSGTPTNATSAVRQYVASQTANDSITTTLSAFGSTDNATASWIVAYDDASTTGPAITAGTGFSIVTGANGTTAAGGDGIRLAFQFKNTNDTSVDATAAAANDRMLQVAMELRALFAGSGSAAISGTGTLSASATRTRFASAAISGSGTFAASATRTRFASAAVSGSGAFSATVTCTRFRDAAVSGSGTLAASAVRTGVASAAITGAGAWSASAVRTGLAEGAVSGSGAWSASATRTRFAEVAVSGSGVWSAAAIATKAGTAGASITGSGSWSATATRTVYVSVQASGSGSWSADAAVTKFCSASVAGVGSWSATTVRTVYVSVGTVATGVWSARAEGSGVTQARFGGSPYSRRELDKKIYDDKLASILADDEEVLLCLLT